MDNKECCPRLIPEDWENRTFEWEDKIFLKAKVLTFMYIPLNFGHVMTKLMRKLEKENVSSPDNLCLSEHTSKWNMNLYLAIDKEMAGEKIAKLNGKFLSKVYEGQFQETQKWFDDFNTYAKDNSYDIQKTYMWYTTCPKCAKKYGKNYTVIFGKIEQGI